jgi:hypothetical protein
MRIWESTIGCITHTHIAYTGIGSITHFSCILTFFFPTCVECGPELHCQDHEGVQRSRFDRDLPEGQYSTPTAVSLTSLEHSSLPTPHAHRPASWPSVRVSRLTSAEREREMRDNPDQDLVYHVGRNFHRTWKKTRCPRSAGSTSRRQ